MGLLDGLLGNSPQQHDYQHYVQRYQQGAPHEGYSDQEVLQRYQQVAPQLPQQDYQQAAEQAFSRMSPQERMQFGQYGDPGYLAQHTAQLHQHQPGLLTLEAASL